MPKDLRSSALLGLAVLLIALAVLTTLPFPSSRPNLIGYRSLCAFVPLSTIILLGVAGFALVFRSSLAQTKSQPRRDEHLKGRPQP